MSTAFDKSKPHQSIKDFNTQRTILVQGGRQFTEQGFPLLVKSAAVKYRCPKCDFGSNAKANLLDHAEKVHQAEGKMMDVFLLYVLNIENDFPADEGINWQKMSTAPTPRQIAIQDGGSEGKQESASKSALACPACPDMEFKNQQALAAHKRHRHPK